MGPEQYIRLSQLNDRIQDAISSRFRGQTYWVVADITNHSFKADRKIHYFELVEKAEKNSAITAKIMGKAWGEGAVNLSDFEKKTGQRFTNNLHVLVKVSVDYHLLYGLSVNVLDIDVNFTLGVLEQQRNATLARLVEENDFIIKTAEGYSTLNSRLQLPIAIQRVAVISASNSAGNEDFRHTLQHNDFGYAFQIDDYNTVVQGDNNAKLFLNKLIEVYNTKIPYDAIVITRGGGSQSDFLIFDNYQIGRAVAKFPIPILTGIGHQKNVSITDLMAHTHTKTPTKAAEFIIAHNRSFETRLLSLQQHIVIRSQQLLLRHSKALEEQKRHISRKTRELLSQHRQQLASANQSIAADAKDILHEHQKKLSLKAHLALQFSQKLLRRKKSDVDFLAENLKRFASGYLRGRRLHLDHLDKSIKLMSPQNILKKGYAIVKANGKIAGTGENIKIGEDIEVILHDTVIKSTVKEKIQYDGRETDL
ncbi:MULTISPECIES: exodeoxyribonuclease VII large subunit [Flavobacterium]|uniref:exodeoxyribonuclease VII large subunit n=1 Tax=Flavobacterium TaxID=237 RepID=UPI001183C51D|nr:MULTISPECIES: exodeoxyribonuclease VII large subunit [Flavobacterium]MCR4032121.1 exodeoxyribonuclease VII large subunit [Flavobacterium panacis]